MTADLDAIEEMRAYFRQVAARLRRELALELRRVAHGGGLTTTIQGDQR